MQMIADILLAAGALGAALYCMVLAGRLKRFNNLQNGMGGAVAVLSAQVDDMTKTLQKAQKAAATSSVSLTGLTERAEDVARRLELMLAAMHDLPELTGQPDSGENSPVLKERVRAQSAPPAPVPSAPQAPPEPAMPVAADPSPPMAAPPVLRSEEQPSSEPQNPRAPEPEPFSEPKPAAPQQPLQDAPVFLSHRDHGIEAAG